MVASNKKQMENKTVEEEKEKIWPLFLFVFPSILLAVSLIGLAKYSITGVLPVFMSVLIILFQVALVKNFLDKVY